MITIIKNPALFSPALNDSIWQIQTDRADILYFLVTVTKPDGVSVLSKLKIYPTPAYRTGSYINLTEILKNVAQTTIKKNDVIVQDLDDVYSYRLTFTEYIYNVSNNSTSVGASTQSSFFHAFNAQLPKITMSDYDYSKLTATGTSVPKFLTNKPTSTTKYWTTEYLYYLNNGRATGVDIHLYYTTGKVVKAFPINQWKKSGRVNISPRAFAVNGISLDNLLWFSVNLVSGNDVASQSVVRYYNNLAADCSDEPVNVIWTNTLGGTDSYLFKNPREKVAVDKVTIKTNPFAVNSAGFYVSGNDNIYQNNEVIVASDSTSEYTLTSDWLNNSEAAWIASIIASKAVYVELTNGKLLPVKVLNTSASITNSKYSKALNSFELTFQSETGLTYSIIDAINDNQIVGMIGTSNPDIVLQTADFEYVVGLNGVVRI
jgi:hypothetical protein